MRNNLGCLILDEYERLEYEKQGRKEKILLQSNGGEYIFKYTPSNYEIWAELFASEIGKQCGLPIVEYDLASYRGIIGVVSKRFDKRDEEVINGEQVFELASKTAKQKNLSFDINSIHSIENISLALSTFMSSDNIEKILKPLIELWCFDGLLMESDRNATNWCLIKNGDYYTFSPYYDFSTIARMNNNVSNLVANLRTEMDIARMTDSIRYSLVFKNEDDNHDFLGPFRTFCEKYPKYSKEIMDKFSKIDVELAISTVEEKLNKNKVGDDIVEFPWEVKIWLRKVIGFRLNDMKSIYKTVGSVGTPKL